MDPEVTTKTFLPPEVLIDLLAFLDIKDLKSFRRCSKLLAKEGARLLFHTLIVFLQGSSYEHLRDVSDQEHLRLYVRRICYVGNRYRPGLSMDQWRHHYGQGQRDQLNAVVWLQKPYAAYKEISNEQQKLLSTRGDIETWHYALERFPNLRDFRVLMREARKPNHGHLGSMMSRTFVEPDVNTDYRYPLPAIPILSRFIDLPNRGTTRKRLPILHTLHLEGIDAHCLSNLTASPPGSGPSLTYLHGLRDLRLDLATSTGSATDPHTGRPPSLQNFLIAAKGIVKFRISWLMPAWHLQLTEIFHDEYTWADLSHVELKGIVFSPTTIADFLERHRTSLRRLTIRASAFEDAESMDNQGRNTVVALLNGVDVSELDPSGSFSGALATSAIYCGVKDDVRSFVASWT